MSSHEVVQFDVQPRQPVPGSSEYFLKREQSLDEDRVRRSIWPNSFIQYDETGQRYPVIYRDHQMFLVTPNGQEIPYCKFSEPSDPDAPLVVSDFNMEIAKRTCAAHAVPTAPWGDVDFMGIVLGHGSIASLVDVPYPLRQALLKDSARIMRHLQNDYNVVNLGYIASMAGLYPHQGGQSVMHHHHHIWTNNNVDIRFRSPKDISLDRDSRDGEWDKLSRTVGINFLKSLDGYILPRFWPAGINSGYADAMGATFFLPNFQPEDIARPELIDNFLRPISHAMHYQLSLIHNEYFNSDFSKVVELALAAHKTGRADMAAYARMFEPNPNRPSDFVTQELDRLKNINMLREGFGWSLNLVSYRDCDKIQLPSGVNPTDLKNGTFFIITTDFSCIPFGGVEALGIRKLIRPEKPLPRSKLEQLTAYYAHLAHSDD